MTEMSFDCMVLEWGRGQKEGSFDYLNNSLQLKLNLGMVVTTAYQRH